ncbi:MAG TPA: L-seryl-tRNA(Sec) selenium transferase, partial [Chthoniobacterales bacterium]|nr:L-seryl-tRNA(Sec) selenium transferase [Chthoniobacterales bacterium]
MHDKIVPQSRRHLPAVNKVLAALDHLDLPRRVVVAIVRRELAALRESDSVVTFDDVFNQVMHALDRHRRSRLQPVINGTGVILHTNFGRAPLADRARELFDQFATSYSNLEFDLGTGQRGNRAEYLETNLAILCGAEAATIVNNCAAALVLIVRHFTREKAEIVISRGELVQIGGGFRIGEIIEAAGAQIREVGATNKTTLADYARATLKDTALILRVHRSNFFMEGFVDSPSVHELAALARKRRVPLIVDLGSGLVERIEELGETEVTPSETLRSGADLVCFSGDKLFGGPQAGIIVGKKRF